MERNFNSSKMNLRHRRNGRLTQRHTEMSRGLIYKSVYTSSQVGTEIHKEIPHISQLVRTIQHPLVETKQGLSGSGPWPADLLKDLSWPRALSHWPTTISVQVCVKRFVKPSCLFIVVTHSVSFYCPHTHTFTLGDTEFYKWSSWTCRFILHNIKGTHDLSFLSLLWFLWWWAAPCQSELVRIFPSIWDWWCLLGVSSYTLPVAGFAGIITELHHVTVPPHLSRGSAAMVLHSIITPLYCLDK